MLFVDWRTCLPDNRNYSGSGVISLHQLETRIGHLFRKNEPERVHRQLGKQN